MIIINNKKRLIIIIILIFIALILFSITKIYERKLSNKEIQTINNYEPFKKAKNFKQENSERYIRYYEKNKNLDYEEIVTHVNIGLDYGFYNYITNSDISKNNLILVNKFLKLNKDYVPKNLEEINSKYFINGNKNVRLLKKEAKEAFEKLSNDSIKNNTPVYGQSAYRSYDRQKILYDKSLKENGRFLTDSDTARPGHSEHQTGLSIDVSSTKTGNMLTFDSTDSFNWMKYNAHKYGFILRYPEGKENITGYKYESWHYRYVGVKTATDMYNKFSNLTFDEYYFKYVDINKKSG